MIGSPFILREISYNRQAITEEMENYIDGVDNEAPDFADSTTEDTLTKPDPPPRPRTTKNTAAATRKGSATGYSPLSPKTATTHSRTLQIMLRGLLDESKN